MVLSDYFNSQKLVKLNLERSYRKNDDMFLNYCFIDKLGEPVGSFNIKIKKDKVGHEKIKKAISKSNEIYTGKYLERFFVIYALNHDIFPELDEGAVAKKIIKEQVFVNFFRENVSNIIDQAKKLAEKIKFTDLYFDFEHKSKERYIQGAVKRMSDIFTPQENHILEALELNGQYKEIENETLLALEEAGYIDNNSQIFRDWILEEWKLYVVSN